MRFKQWIAENSEEIPVVGVEQQHDYDCGAAALRAIAKYYGVGPETNAEFIKLCNTSERKGTNPRDLACAAQKLGLHAKVVETMTQRQLISLLSHKVPVICAVQAWGDEEDYDRPENGHYIVAIGYRDGNIYFEDPSIKTDSRGFMPEDEFMGRWHDREAYTDKPQFHLGIAIWGSPKAPDRKEKAEKVESQIEL